MNGVIDKLCKHAELLSERAHCGRDQCVARTLLMTKLYMKVRIMHTLKVSNTVGTKWPRHKEEQETFEVNSYLIVLGLVYIYHAYGYII